VCSWSFKKYKFWISLDNEITGEFSSHDDGVLENDYTQLVTPGTHVIVDSESDNDSNE
jgi:hypothetical protein